MDLKWLNRLIQVPTFCMESLQSILPQILRNDWLTSVNLADAYLHISLSSEYQKYLSFCIGGQHFPFVRLLFGLSMAPQTFTKTPLPLVAHLREQGIRLHHYLDNILHWWWLNRGNLFNNHLIVKPIPLVVTTDASLCHFSSLFAQGTWSFPAQHVPSNTLETHAVRALWAFAPLLYNKLVHLKMDNRMAIAYINHQGGTRSRSMTIPYLPGPQNSVADQLSRSHLSSHEWSLNQEVFSMLVDLWGQPQVDLFATPANTKFSRFMMRFQCCQAEATNALICPWNFSLGYAYPPQPLISRFLQRMAEFLGTVIAVLPFWPRRPWIAALLQLSQEPPFLLPPQPDLLIQGHLLHPNPAKMKSTFHS